MDSPARFQFSLVKLVVVSTVLSLFLASLGGAFGAALQELSVFVLIGAGFLFVVSMPIALLYLDYRLSDKWFR